MNLNDGEDWMWNSIVKNPCPTKSAHGDPLQRCSRSRHYQAEMHFQFLLPFLPLFFFSSFCIMIFA